MKYFMIFLVLIGFVGLAFAAPGFTSQQIYDFSDIIAVGEVTFVNSTFSPTMNLYHIQVEKFLKNPQDSNETLAAGSKTASIRAGNEVFDVGDRALFFLVDDIARMYPIYSGIYEVSTVSQSMDPNWDKCNIFEKNIPPDHWVFGGRNNHLQVSQENKTDDFVTDKKITISYDIFNHEPVTKKVDFGMMVKNIDEPESLYEFTETAYRILEPCTVYETISWSFTPSEPANYLAEFYDLKGHTTGITIPVKSDTGFSGVAPLKQWGNDISFNEIQCKQNLVLIQKYDGSPACVTESTKLKLIERGWTGEKSWTTSYDESNIPSVIIPLGSGSVTAQKNFEPQTIKVVLGINNTIQWINQDDVPSSVTSDHDYNGHGFVSPHLKPGDSWTHTFTKAGIYDYHSIPHPWKNGKVLVLGDNIDERLQMAQEILGQYFRKLPIVSIGAGNADRVFDVTIHEDELEKFQDAESHYKNIVEQIIPFDVPIRINFGEYKQPE